MGLAEKYAAYQTFKENLRGQKLQNDERQRLADLQGGMTSAAQNPDVTTMTMQPEQPKLSLSALGSQLQPPQFQPAQVDTSPIVDAYKDGRMQMQTVKRSPELATFEYLRQNDPAQAQKYADGVLSQARNIALNGDHQAAVDFVNKSIGLGIKYISGKDDVMTIANGDGTHILYNVRTGKEQTLGKPKPMTLSPGGVVYDPQTKEVVFTAPKEVGKPFSREYDEGDTHVTELYDGSGKLTETKRAPRYKPTATGSVDKDYRKQSYQLQKEIRGDKYVNQADDSKQKLSAMENAYAEGKRTGNYVGADQAIGYYVNKLFDPDSVVMVSEFQRVAQSQGVPSKILGSLQSVATGGIKLTDESRDALIRTVKEINNTVQTRKAERLKQYRMDAISLGLDPDNILAGRDATGGPPENSGKTKDSPSRSVAPILSYFKTNTAKYAQNKMVQQLRKSGWSDAEIGAAWAEYKRGR